MAGSPDRSDTPDRSASDLDILRRSHRGKFVALAALLATAGGLVWWNNRPGPIGNDEQAERVLVVPATNWRYKPYLEKWGFVAQEGRLKTMVDELKEKVPEATEDGPAAVLKLADWAGFAFVAFEDPKSLDFSGLDIEGGVPTFAEHHRFAVVSAGDYAFPHKLTVNAEPSEFMNGPELDLLSALFAQEPLASTLRDDPKNSPDVIVLRTKVQEGIDAFDAITAAEATVAKIADKARVLLVDKEQGQPKPTLLGGVQESVHPIALADGGTLLLARKANFSSSSGFNADLELATTWQFFHVPAGADPVAGRVPCTSLLGGSLEETGRSPVFRSSPQGDVLQIHEAGRSRLFKLEQGGCNFTALGEITVPIARGDDPGEPHRSGRVARAQGDGRESVVYLVKPGDEVAFDLVRTTKASLQLPVWLDDDVLAGPAEERVDPDNYITRAAIYFYSASRPERALRLDAQNFNAASQLQYVAWAPPGPQGARLLVRAWGPQTGEQLFRVDAPAPASQLFADAIAEAEKTPLPAEVRDGMEPLVVPIDTRGWTFTPIVSEFHVDAPVASPDGRLVAFASDNELHVVPLAGGTVRTLTRNELEDHTPMFSADGKTVVFRTRFPIEKTNWTLTTARSVPAGE
ncbi:hypothetical protein [Nannocystis sp. SCPEA4]|uniref:hypothetical protein n=1 Tax=Nannocystis sp. SCPEA4 TaxID=2996787 RepID=UPI00226FD788|nr:hypothetical protein [Nannocystis sp. SCPEA4]MCY1056075.1 hypothetical protein [Nannocystis sp. SCPEA4]